MFKTIKETIKDKNFSRKLVTLAIPIALQALMLSLVGASDTIMLGALDQNSMASVSLANQIQFVQNITIMGVVSAFQILGSQYAGKDDKDTLNKVFCMALRLCTLLSIIFFLLCFFIPSYLMRIFASSNTLISIGTGYLKTVCFAYLLTGASQCLLGLLKVAKNTGTVAKISAVSVICNIVLNACLIFGLFGLPKLGVKGAALATVIARIIEFVLALVCAYKDKFAKPDLKKLFSHNKTLSGDFLRQLLPILGAYLLWTIGITAYSAFMGHLGEDSAAANSVAATMKELIGCFCKGLAGGTSIIIGYELGSGNINRAKAYGDRLLKLSFVIGFIETALVLLSIPLALKVVSLTEQAKTYFISISIVLSIYVIGQCFNSTVINGMFASGGDTLYDVYSIAFTMWLIAVPLAFLGTFYLNWPVAIIYACTCLDEVGKIPWTFMHYKKYKWLRDLTRNNIEN